MYMITGGVAKYVGTAPTCRKHSQKEKIIESVLSFGSYFIDEERSCSQMSLAKIMGTTFPFCLQSPEVLLSVEKSNLIPVWKPEVISIS